MTTPDERYPGYLRVPDEEVEWFAAPLVLGTLRDRPGEQRLLALGITDKLEARIVDALIVGIEGHLDRLWTLAVAEGRLGLRAEPASGLRQALGELGIEWPKEGKA